MEETAAVEMDRNTQNDRIRRHLNRQTLTAAAAAAIQMKTSPRDNLRKMSRLLYNPDPIVRTDAVRKMVDTGSREAIPHINQLLNDRDFRVRMEICTGLGKLRAFQAKNKLYDAISDRNIEVRCAAAAALADMGDKYGLPHIIRLVSTKGDHQLKALRALCHITGQKFSINPRGLKEAIRWLKLRKKTI